MSMWTYGVPAILGLAVVTFVTRNVFLWSEREPRIPEGLRRALQVAPLAAIVAVLAPEIVMTQGEVIHTWRDARLFGAAAGSLWYVARRGMLGPLLAGMAVYLPLHLLLGW
jgi:branched-subunit amino acid transport protein